MDRTIKIMEEMWDDLQAGRVRRKEVIKRFMDEARKEGLHEKTKILAGVTPLKSAGMAKFMNRL